MISLLNVYRVMIGIFSVMTATGVAVALLAYHRTDVEGGMMMVTGCLMAVGGVVIVAVELLEYRYYLTVLKETGEQIDRYTRARR